MDLKGITWVGNFYQKFEAMCLEVEETIYEDTVKYVENQVQTVGASVKKFYSDVMEDLLPPSTMDPSKPIELYADVEGNMKPKVGMEDKHVKTNEIEQLEDPKMTIATVLDHSPTFDRLRYLDNLSLQSKGDSKRYGKRSLPTKSNLSTNKVSKRENQSPNETIGIVIPSDKDLIRLSSLCELPNESHEIPFDPKARITTPDSVEVTGLDSMEESKNESRNESELVPEISTSEPSSLIVNLVESDRIKGIDTRHSAFGSLLAESDVDVCMNNEVVSLVESYADENTESIRFADDYFVFNSGRPDDKSTDVDAEDGLIEQEVEIVQQVDEAKLEETCVMVNGDEFYVLREGKNRPFKKKICDAFSPTKRSMRKQEYEQLAVWYSDDSKSDQGECGKGLVPTPLTDTERSPAPGTCESEWELV